MSELQIQEMLASLDSIARSLERLSEAIENHGDHAVLNVFSEAPGITHAIADVVEEIRTFPAPS